MKTRLPVLLLLVGVVGGLLWFSSCTSVSEPASAPSDRNVVIDDRGIFIPGTAISATDHAAMNRILNKYDKALYRIDTYENGKLKQTQGKLTDVVTDKRLASQIAANVKRAGFTQYAVQIRAGFTTNVQISPTPGATVHVQISPRPGSTTNIQISPTPGSTTHPQMSKSNESTERLRSILKKYQKK